MNRLVRVVVVLAMGAVGCGPRFEMRSMDVFAYRHAGHAYSHAFVVQEDEVKAGTLRVLEDVVMIGNQVVPLGHVRCVGLWIPPSPEEQLRGLAALAGIPALAFAGAFAGMHLCAPPSRGETENGIGAFADAMIATACMGAGFSVGLIAGSVFFLPKTRLLLPRVLLYAAPGWEFRCEELIRPCQALPSHMRFICAFGAGRMLPEAVFEQGLS